MEKVVKIVVAGEMATGKTSLLARHLYSSFNPDSAPTVGVDFLVSRTTRAGQQLKLQFWDTAGQERFLALMPSYLRNANIALLVYDISRKETFEKIPGWLQRLADVNSNQPRTDSEDSDQVGSEDGKPLACKVVLVGNKKDLRSEESVSETEGAEMKAQTGAAVFFETSCKDDTNIKELFEAVLALIPDDEKSLATFLGESTERSLSNIRESEVSHLEQSDGVCGLPCL